MSTTADSHLMKAALIFLALAAAAVSSAAAASKPNILFVFSDDHALQAISAYNYRGRSLNQTPNIDRLAKEGALFRSNYCANSICSPSRACVLTGKHSHLNGVVTWERFDGAQFTFPKALRRAGYHTALFGKWHLSSNPTGFDEWMVHPGQGSYYNPDFHTPEGDKRIEGYATEITTDLTLDFIRRNKDSGRPFLAMCQYKAPHRTWQPDLANLETYDGVTFAEPENLFDDYAKRPLAAKNLMEIGRHMRMDYDLKHPAERIFELERMTPGQRALFKAAFEKENASYAANPPQGRDLVRWKYQRYMRDYLRTVQAIDDNVGRLLGALKEMGLEENTIVIYSSDQGFFLGEHGWFDKRWMYEESFLMPLLVRWPGVVKPGTEITRLTQNIDFAPTLLEAAGCAIPEDVQGKSLAPLLKGENVPWRDALYYHYYDGPGEHGVPKQYGVRTDRYKLIRFYAEDQWELYDLEKDPHEMNPVQDDPAYAGVRAELAKRLDELKEQYNNPIRTAADEQPFLQSHKPRPDPAGAK